MKYYNNIMITIMLVRFPLSNEALGPGGYFMNVLVGMCHWDPESLACAKTSSAQFCYSLLDQTGIKLFFETISLYLVCR